METISIGATTRSPAIEFNFKNNSYVIKGESYPEDVTAFYGPLMEKLEAHVSGLKGATIGFRFELVYFNSSTAKILMRLFELLEAAATRSNQVVITWVYEEGDDNIKELAEEFAEELKKAKFVFEEVPV
jgi:formyltetrahydrofolate synthetase